MTPAQLEHLKLIDAHLERLLAIAEKRTPGRWCHQPYDSAGESTAIVAQGFKDKVGRTVALSPHYGNFIQDAAFIASCAGNAEAGWRATRAVIKRFHDSAICREWHGYMQTAVEPILAAFPLELIQKP